MNSLRKLILNSIFSNFFSIHRVCYQKSTGYVLKCSQDICRFCKGSGGIICMTCNGNGIYRDNTKEYRCSDCENGSIICSFCGGNGQSHQIF